MDEGCAPSKSMTPVAARTSPPRTGRGRVLPAGGSEGGEACDELGQALARGLVRQVAIGIEDAEDIIADLDQALAKF